MTGLSVKNLSYSYGAKTALDDVSFDVQQGNFCALLGPNGAGKSTLFSLLTRLFVAPQGQLLISGHDLKKTPRPALGALGVVFQQSTLDLDMSVMANMRYFASLHGMSSRDARAPIEAALHQLNIADRADEKVRNLNGGHRRRTEIARALIHNPSVLLLDEPTVGLDAAARESITTHVHALTGKGMTVLWATHLVDEIWPQDQVVVLHNGKILDQKIAHDFGPDLKKTFLSMTGGAI